MARRPRKGASHTPLTAGDIDLSLPVTTPAHTPTSQIHPSDGNSDIVDPLCFWNVSSSGHGYVSRFLIDLRKFSGNPLIEPAALLLFRKRFEGKSRETCRARIKELSGIVAFVNWYEGTFRKTLSSIHLIDDHALNQFIVWVARKNIAEPTKAALVHSMNRFLDEMNAPGHLRVPQPFETRTASDWSGTLSDREIKAILDQCKREITVLQRRVREAHSLAARGHDPRRGHGGAFRDWQKPECRAWIIKRLLRRELHTFDEMRFEMGMNTVLRGLEGKPGAEAFRADGNVVRQTGWSGHIRWFFPSPDDIVPFVVLLMIRTGWNLATVASLRTRAWCEPIPFSRAPDGRVTHVNIVSIKIRGRQNTGQRASVEKAPSPKKPRFHAYKLLKFIEYWTAAIRKEVYRKIHELKTTAEYSQKTLIELCHLEDIKDDLFIFKNGNQITSLSQEGSIQRSLEFFRSRTGVDFVTRDIRNAALMFSYQASGQNLFVVQILANHADPNTTALYLRRKQTLERTWEQFRNVFSASMKLAEDGNLSQASLRQKLGEQGYSETHVNNLLDPESSSRWGNRCADPRNPPSGFDHRHEAGEACASQDCIDGCPYARWFSDSIQHVANNLVAAEKRRDRIGLEASLASTLDDRIERCRVLLAKWPKYIADEAVQMAREAIPDDADGILSAALGMT